MSLRVLIRANQKSLQIHMRLQNWLHRIYSISTISRLGTNGVPNIIPTKARAQFGKHTNEHTPRTKSRDDSHEIGVKTTFCNACCRERELSCSKPSQKSIMHLSNPS